MTGEANFNASSTCNFWKDNENVDVSPWTKYLDKNYNYVEVPRRTKEELQKASDNDEVDVLVIGGGFSGVQTLTTLNAAGLNAWLVEGMESLGGRCTSVGYTNKEDPKKTARFDCGAEYLGLAQKALWTYVTDIYPQYRSTMEEATTTGGKKEEPKLEEERQTNEEKAKDNPRGLKNLTGKGRPNRDGASVEVIDFTKYQYTSPPAPEIPETPHIDPFNAGLPAAIPTQFNFLRDMTPVNSALIFAGLYSSMINVDDIFYEEETDPKKKFENTIVKALKQLDELSIADWVKLQNYLPKPMQDLVNISVVAPLSLEAEQVSALAFMEYAKLNGSLLYLINDADWGPQQYIMKSSFQTVANTIAAEACNDGRIVLGQKVTKVEYTSGEPEEGYVEGAVVYFSDGTTVKTKQVVVAMSPWTAGAYIDFTKVQKLRKVYNSPEALVMGKTIKLFFVYKEAWWREKNEDKNLEPYSGYSGSWGNTNAYNQKYSKVRVNGEGVSSTEDKFNPATVIWTMDNSHDEEGIYVLMAFIVADQVKKVNDDTGKPSFDKSKQACLQHFFEFFGRNPDCEKDRELVAGSNLESCFGGCWDENGFIGGGPDAFPKPGTVTKYESKLKTQGIDDNGQVLPIFFSGSELAEEFRGYMSGAISGGNKVAFQIVDYMSKHTSKKLNNKVQPYYDLMTKNSYYNQFDTIKLKTGQEVAIPQGYLDIEMAPTIQVYQLFDEFSTSINNLNVSEIIKNPEIDPFGSVDTVTNLVETITTVPNPGLFPEKFRNTPAIQRATALMYSFTWGNFPAFLQLCDVNAVLSCPGPEEYKKALPFIGDWKGTNPQDPNGIMGFFMNTMVINETITPFVSYSQTDDEDIIIFQGGSYIVPPGYETPEYNKNLKEGTDWVFSDTINQIHLDKKTGYCNKILVIQDNLSIYELLKVNNLIPKDLQTRKMTQCALIKSSSFKQHSSLLNYVNGVKYFFRHVEEYEIA
mmetsp:Transcript_32/g.53  ORF Transcript_32/g.53 Transcript_32/m.53 type:complete len:976 (+) Transcript_32:71-2998(+)